MAIPVIWRLTVSPFLVSGVTDGVLLLLLPA